jgi:hypothetical protein
VRLDMPEITDSEPCPKCGAIRYAIPDQPPSTTEEDRDRWHEIANRLQERLNAAVGRIRTLEATRWLACMVILTGRIR